MPTLGEEFECRVARLYEAEGGFVRRRVDLQAYLHEKFTVTDIDVFVVSFSPSLESRVVVGECKTTEAKNAPNAADRLLWMTGVRQVVAADSSFLATLKPATPRVRHLASLLHSDVLDVRDLERRERVLDLAGTTATSSHTSELLSLAAEVFQTSKRDAELRRVYWFTRSELWLAQPYAALKRALGACRLLVNRWSPRLPEAERRTVEWLMLECVVGFTLAVVRVAGTAYRLPEDAFRRDLAERLTEGVVSYDAMTELSESVDQFLIGVLTDAGVDPARRVASLGALQPRPPSYTEALAELVIRVAAAPRAAVELTRTADRLMASHLLARPRGREEAKGEREVGRMLRLVTAFLGGQIGLPDTMAAVFSGEEASTAPRAASADPQLALPGEAGLAAPSGDATNAVPANGALGPIDSPAYHKNAD